MKNQQAIGIVFFDQILIAQKEFTGGEERNFSLKMSIFILVAAAVSTIAARLEESQVHIEGTHALFHAGSGTTQVHVLP